MSDEIRAQLKSLNEKRTNLLRQLSTLDHEIRECQKKLEPPPPKTERLFLCRCGERFEFFLDRLQHLIDFEGNNMHGDEGELIDGKQIIRDTSISGNPISSRRSIKKFDAFTVDVDDLA